jgi:hypothetical protein
MTKCTKNYYRYSVCFKQKVVEEVKAEVYQRLAGSTGLEARGRSSDGFSDMAIRGC